MEQREKAQAGLPEIVLYIVKSGLGTGTQSHQLLVSPISELKFIHPTLNPSLMFIRKMNV